VASVLVVGIDPAAVPGMAAAGIRAALDAELRRFAEHGIAAAIAFNTSGGDSVEAAQRWLTAASE
jgi:hypothetical protein